MSDDKVVVDCSARPGAISGQVLRDAALRALEAGDMEEADRLIREAAAPVPAKAVRVPLTPEEIAQRDIDRAKGVENARAELRLERDGLLRGSDWRVLPDAPTPPAKLVEWKAYRQALRDMDFSDVLSVVWPTPPA